MRRSFVTQRWWFLLVVAALATGGAACKKRKLPTLDPDEPPVAAASVESAPAPGEKKRPAPPAPVGGRPRELPAEKGVPVGMINREPERATETAFDFPLPEGIKALGRTQTSAVFETIYTVDALKRFYSREVGRDGQLEERAYGFKIDAPGGNGFIMVTHPPGTATTTLSLIGPKVRPLPRNPESETH